jgi:hypothetical protein
MESAAIHSELAAGQERKAFQPAGMTPLTRVRFTEDDLARVRFCAVPAPLVEAVLGFAELRYQLSGMAASHWARQARRTFPVTARPLLDLIPASGPWPEFLDPATADLEEALEIVCSTPRSVLRNQLAASWRLANPAVHMAEGSGGR